MTAAIIRIVGAQAGTVPTIHNCFTSSELFEITTAESDYDSFMTVFRCEYDSLPVYRGVIPNAVQTTRNCHLRRLSPTAKRLEHSENGEDPNR
jgi:hypothetical protein